MKVVLLGSTKVGKTSLINRLTGGVFLEEPTATVGASFQTYVVTDSGRCVAMQIWDTAGQEVFKAITRSYYRDSHCAIVVYDITDTGSFEKVDEWVRDVRNFASPNCVLVLVGNKCDLESRREVSFNQGQDFADRQGLIFFETSAMTGENVDALFNECVKTVVERCKMAPIQSKKLKEIDSAKNRCDC